MRAWWFDTDSARRVGLAGLLAVAMVMFVLPVTASSQLALGSIELFEFNSIRGSGFTPDSTVSIRIFDGESLLYSGTVATGGEGMEPGEFYAGSDADGIVYTPGMRIVVVDDALADEYGEAAATKELIVAPLTYDLLDANSDLAAGTASPGTWVYVAWPDGEDHETEPQALADANGRWIVDFGELGFDVSPRMTKHEPSASIADDDNDHLRMYYRYPVVSGDLTSDLIVGWFLANTPATVQIMSASGDVLYSEAILTSRWGGNFQVERATHGQDLIPGMRIRVTQGGIYKEVTLAFVRLDYFDVLTTVERGRVDPDTRVTAAWTIPAMLGDGVELASDHAGRFSINFWESQGWDLQGHDPLVQGYAEVMDGDGDSTLARLLSPADAIAEIVAGANYLVGDGMITAKEAKPLLSGLAQAKSSVEASRPRDASKYLRAFVADTWNLVKAGKLPPTAGARLMDDANAILDRLGG